MANGNSKMYYSGDMIRCVERAGLEVSAIYDNLGSGNSHTLFLAVAQILQGSVLQMGNVHHL